jgi:hypothetical protein
MVPEIGELTRRLAHLGFLLESPFPERPGEARLLVAFRDRPTLDHFDPEIVRFWRTGEDRRGHAAELTLDSRTPMRDEFTWGRLEVVDRLGVENAFATLGGELRMEDAGPGLAIAVFTSPGPILRLGGHSQDVDRVALELGAFFGRIMVPIDFEPGVEEAISGATPLERYAAFVAFEQSRYSSHVALREEQPATASLIAGEAHRLARGEPASWEGGSRLLSRMGLAPAG